MVSHARGQRGGEAGSGEGPVVINRAPVLTLWAAVVAERLGFARSEALSLGKALAGLNAYSKGRSLGLYHERAPEERRRRAREIEEKRVELMGRGVPVVRTREGMRAVSGGRAVGPDSVERYLEEKFGDRLGEVRAAMEELASNLPREELAERAYGLYEMFRPVVPRGARGWAARGELDLELIRSLAPRRGSGRG